MGTCAHNIFCFGGQVINHKYPKHKEEVEGLEKSNVQRNAIYIYYNKVLHRKNIIGQISIILFYYILEIVTCLVSSVFINRQTTTDIIYSYYHLSEMWLQYLLLLWLISIVYCVCLTTYLQWK